MGTGHLHTQGALPTANRLGGQGAALGRTLPAALILTKEEQNMAGDQGPGPRAWPLAGAVTRTKTLLPEEGLPSPQPLALPCDGAHFHEFVTGTSVSKNLERLLFDILLLLLPPVSCVLSVNYL